MRQLPSDRRDDRRRPAAAKRPKRVSAPGHWQHVMAENLAPGDIAVVDGRTLRVLDEPETVHRGWSPLDEFKVMLGFHIQAVGEPANPVYAIIEPREVLPVMRDSIVNNTT